MNTRTRTSGYVDCARRASSSERRRAFSILAFDLKSLIFLDVNADAVRQYGYSHEQFLAMTLRDLVPRVGVSKLLRFARNVPEKHVNTIVWQHLKKDGGIIVVEMQCYKFVFQGDQIMIALTRETAEPARLVDTLACAPRKYRTGPVRPMDIVSRVDRRLMFLELQRELDWLTGQADGAISEPDAGVDEPQRLTDGQQSDPDCRFNVPVDSGFSGWGSMVRSLRRVRLRSLFAHLQSKNPVTIRSDGDQEPRHPVSTQQISASRPEARRRLMH